MRFVHAKTTEAVVNTISDCKYDREAPNFGNAYEYDSCSPTVQAPLARSTVAKKTLAELWDQLLKKLDDFEGYHF